MLADFTLTSVRKGKLIFQNEPEPDTPDPAFDRKVEGVLGWVAERIHLLPLPHRQEFTCEGVTYGITITQGWRDDPNDYADIVQIGGESDDDDENFCP